MTDQPSQTLWAVRSLREIGGDTILHTNWFSTEDGAVKHAEWISRGRGSVLSVAEYTLKSTRVPPKETKKDQS